MIDAGLIRLFSWLSPAFPIGGFAYSQGLETAIAGGTVSDAPTLLSWISGQVHSGALRTDAYFLAIAARAVSSGDAEALSEANQLALALQVSAERDAETREQARSFLDAAATWPITMPDWLAAILSRPMALPCAVGAMVGLHALPRAPSVAGFVNAAVTQQISVGIRLIPLGQSAGLGILAQCEGAIQKLGDDAMEAAIADVASLSYGTDIASLRHEDLKVRIFRS